MVILGKNVHGEIIVGNTKKTEGKTVTFDITLSGRGLLGTNWQHSIFLYPLDWMRYG